ncbi:hypothetical protein QYF36_004747 [Acer negundo]|nr:hypothetical protein QYF36_004747 [Acer negundo]
MLICVEILELEIVATAPVVPPLPVILDITPNDQITRSTDFCFNKRLSIDHASMRWEKMEPTKEAMLAGPISDCVSLRSSWMMGMSGGMEKVEKKQAKSESHTRWKTRMWGGESDNGQNSMAL